MENAVSQQKRGGKAYTLEDAQAEILKKIEKGGAKGSASLYTKTVAASKKELLDQAVAALEERGELFVDRTGARPKYYQPGLQPKSFTVEDAEDAILVVLEKAGANGALKPKPAQTSQKLVHEQALASLEERREIFVDRRKKTLKYFAWHCRPREASAETVSPRLLEFIKQQYPRVFGEKALAKHAGLNKEEAPHLGAALVRLCEEQKLEELQLVPATGAALAIYIPKRTQPVSATKEPTSGASEIAAVTQAIDESAVKEAYERVSTETGFPSVKISALQQAGGLPMEALKVWLRAQHEAGRVALSVADWSMATEEERDGVIDLHGRRYLQVRWL